MATEIDWESLGGKAANSKGNGGGSKYLQFEADKTYTVRLVGTAVEFYKFYINSARKSIYVDPEDKDVAAKKISQITGEEVVPQHRFAVNVIDRSDARIKILEGGFSIFKFFGMWSKANDGAHPGGKGGVDWTISVEGKTFKDRRYTPMAGQAAPFTADEVSMLKEEGSMHSLKEVFKSIPVDQVESTIKSWSESSDEPVAATVAAGAAKADELSDNPDDWF